MRDDEKNSPEEQREEDAEAKFDRLRAAEDWSKLSDEDFNELTRLSIGLAHSDDQHMARLRKARLERDGAAKN